MTMACRFPLATILFLLGLMLAVPHHAMATEQTSLQPFISAKTKKTMEQTLADLNMAIESSNYVFIRRQDVDQDLAEPGQENHRIVFVFFCNFAMLDTALKIDPGVGVFLPCKITLIETDDGIEIIAANPSLVSHALNEPRLDELCEKLTADYRNIIGEAAQ